MSSRTSTHMRCSREKRKGATLQRVIDLSFALTLGIALLPVFALIGIAVSFAMGAPVLFTQRRAGLGGRPFRIIKFRSMTAARDSDGKLLPDAERITPLGRVLRR